MSRHQPRTPLDRTAVLAAAVALADDAGLAAISMRALAERLGVVPMALYKHVTDKEDLLAGMIDTVVAGYRSPEVTGWRARVRARVMSARRGQVDHPWMRQAIGIATRPSAIVLAHLDAVAGDLMDDGFTADLTHYAMHALGPRIWGFSAEAFAGPPAGVADPETAAALAMRFPHIAAIAADTAVRNPTGACDERDEFSFALDLLLDSFARLREAGWASTPSASGLPADSSTAHDRGSRIAADDMSG